MKKAEMPMFMKSLLYLGALILIVILLAYAVDQGSLQWAGNETVRFFGG